MEYAARVLPKVSKAHYVVKFNEHIIRFVLQFYSFTRDTHGLPLSSQSLKYVLAWVV